MQKNFKKTRLIVIPLVLIFSTLNINFLHAQPGALDATFNPTDVGFGNGDGVGGGTVYSSILQSDGKVVIVGDFISYNGTARKNIARLNLDGSSVDATFNPGSGTNTPISAIAIQSDGKIIIGGGFIVYNGNPRQRIARLNSDGSIDATFGNTGLGLNGGVNSISIQSDGKIIVGGQFTNYNGTNRNYIARLNTNGSLDASFNPGSGATINPVYSTVLQSDGKIIIGGAFSTYNGVSRNGIARLNADGSLDLTFNPGIGTIGGTVLSTVLQSDGKIIIGGGFTSYNGTARKNIARLNSDGSLDATFDPGIGPNNFVRAIAIQSDGKIAIGGGFTTYFGITRNGIARLNADGSIDATFNPNLGIDNNYLDVYSVSIQIDGRTIISGSFYTFNIGSPRNQIARLNGDGSLDDTFCPRTGVVGRSSTLLASNIQNDGKIIIAGDFNSFNDTRRIFIARVNSNGSLDPSFDPGLGTNELIYEIAIQNDGKIIIVGAFTSFNGTSVNRIARLNPDGSLDATFNIGSGADVDIATIAIQSDGKIIIGGLFSNFNGVARNGIARLNLDGSLDLTFNPGTGLDNWVWSTSIQTDGKIILGGDFTTFNGIGRNRIARLNANGSLDGTFNPGSGSDVTIHSITLQTDGKILIGGEFTTYNGIGRSGIARLNSNGSLDVSFNPGTGVSGGPVYSTVLQSDGKIIIGGFFNTYNGTARVGIARINATGTLDIIFDPGLGVGVGTNKFVYCSALQANGQIIIGGNFTSYNATGRNRLARIFGGGGAPPTITSFTPSSGCASSTSVVITGTNFTGATAVSIGGTAVASFTVNSATQITATVGSGTTGLIVVTTPDGTGTSGSTFTVNPSVLASVSISASVNNVCSGTSITITATPTNGGASPTYNFKVNGITVQNTTSNTYTSTGFVNGDAVTCEMTSNATCPSPSIAISTALNIIINNCAGANAWTGAVSNVWSNTGNWSLGILPGNGDDFLIPNSALQNPVINANLSLIFNNVTIESNQNLTINTNGSIIIDGILNNSGTITINSGGSLVQTINSTLVGSGNYNVKRAIPAGQHFFGSPIQNQNTSSIGINATGTNGAQVIPIQAPSPYRCNADSVALNSPIGNIMEITENAIPIDNCAQSLWSVKSAGNYTNAKGYAVNASTPTTLNFNGTINNGTVTYAGLTRQAGLIDQWSGPSTRGWHLVSNPYPSPIRLTNGALGSGFDNAVYLFNGTNFNAVSLNVSDAVIAVGQGFQIRKSSVGGTSNFTLNNGFREAGNPTFFSQNASITQYLNLVLTGNNQQKAALIYFNENATTAFDAQYDANCLFGLPTNSLIYTTEQNGELLSIDARPGLNSLPQQTIPVGIYDGIPGNFQLSFEGVGTLAQTVYLEDLKLNTIQQISDATNYPFTTIIGDTRDRFLLHLFGNPTLIKEEKLSEIKLFPNPTKDLTTLVFNGENNYHNLDVVDLSGRVVLSKPINSSNNTLTLNTEMLNTGVYFVKLIGETQATLKLLKY
jgi:uncharacterized delta-60 repeat protein